MTQLQLFPVPGGGKKKTTAGISTRPKVNRKLAKKRYYLHKQLSDEFNLQGADRIIDAPYRAFTDIPVGQRYYIGQLIELGYQVPIKLYSEEEMNSMKRDEPAG